MLLVSVGASSALGIGVHAPAEVHRMRHRRRLRAASRPSLIACARQHTATCQLLLRRGTMATRAQQPSGVLVLVTGVSHALSSSVHAHCSPVRADHGT